MSVKKWVGAGVAVAGFWSWVVFSDPAVTALVGSLFGYAGGLWHAHYSQND